MLLSQFNDFDSWVLIPGMESTCNDYLDKNVDKVNVIKYTLHYVKEGLPLKAIEILERYKRDNWPDVYSYILNCSDATFISL